MPFLSADDDIVTNWYFRESTAPVTFFFITLI